LNLLEASFSVSLLVITPTYGRRVSATARRRPCLHRVILIEQKFFDAIAFSFALVVRLWFGFGFLLPSNIELAFGLAFVYEISLLDNAALGHSALELK
jgi:hypothetical protein